MLTIHDLSKEVDMTAVRGGWGGCGDEDSRERHDFDRHRCEPRDHDHDRRRCEWDDDDDSRRCFGLDASFKLSSCGW